MRALIVSDDETCSTKAGVILRRNGFSTSQEDVVSFPRATEIVGRVCSDVVVLILESSDKSSLVMLRDMRHVTSAAIVAIGPATDPKFILTALREGANEYLDRSDIDGELDAFLVRLKAKQSLNASDGRVFTVIAASGGAGASTVACNLAAVHAQQTRECALFDLDVRSGIQSLLLDAKPVHNIADICRHVDRMDQGMLRKSLVAHSSGVRLMASPEMIAGASSLLPRGVRQALTIARTQFRSVVVDVDRSFGVEQAAAIIHADVRIVVLRLDLPCIHNARAILDQLNRMGVSDNRIWLIANRSGMKKELSVKRAEQALGLPVRHFIPEDVGCAVHAQNSGVPVALLRPRSRIAKAFASFGHALLEVDVCSAAQRAEPLATQIPTTNASASSWTVLTRRRDRTIAREAEQAHERQNEETDGSDSWKGLGRAIADA